MPDPLYPDPLAAVSLAGETVSFSDGHKRALLEELAPDESVRAVYHDGWGYAVLTDRGLILLGSLLRPRATRASLPLRILRRASGLLDSVEVLVDGRPHKLHGSKIDPKGALLEAAGELLPPGSPTRPGRGTRVSTWVRRHPVLVSVLAVSVVVGGLGSGSGSGSGSGEPVAKDGKNPAETVVADFQGATLTAAAARAREGGWRKVSTMDATSEFRTVGTDGTGWRVCFQNPARDETVRPSLRTLTLYAVPEREKCPTRLYGVRRVVMPDVVGMPFDDASATLGDLGLDSVSLFHAYTGKPLDEEERDLAVCRQDPEAGTETTVPAPVRLWLIDSGKPCTEPSPTAKPKPKPKPAPKPAPQPSYDGTSGGGSGSGGSSSSGGSGSGGGSSSGGSGSGSGSGSGGRSGIGFGQFCSPVGATATTADGRPAKCFMGKDGRARWGYNSG
ncbi:PASTA domain-containing protein [Streptomyces sp. NRRL S-37]|uniref:PASTA domain-containing protein n=1 Tax=Streptomyces sp. NRRL S-37 TaxID=1463903 RepID=UPI0004CC4077|nr:PASTA domain-containing protein [Streptomyces sp. NRRL S-37]